MGMDALLLSVFFAGICLLNGSFSATLGQESLENAVTVKLYMMQQKDWEASNTKLTDIIYREANEYCKTNHGKCGMKTWQSSYEFTKDEVKYLDKYDDTKYPIYEKNYLSVMVYLMFRSAVPANVKNDTTFVLNYDALEALVVAGRNDIKAAVGFAVIGVGDGEYSPPPDYLLNIIMCIIGLVLLLTVVLTAIGCWLYAKRRDREKKKRESPNRVAPQQEPPRQYRPKKRAPEPQPQHQPQVEYVEEEPIRKHKKKKKSKKHKKEDRQELTVIPMPDGGASYAYKVDTEDEANEGDEEYDSGLHETSSQATQPNNNHYSNNNMRITTDL